MRENSSKQSQQDLRVIRNSFFISLAVSVTGSLLWIWIMKFYAITALDVFVGTLILYFVVGILVLVLRP